MHGNPEYFLKTNFYCFKNNRDIMKTLECAEKNEKNRIYRKTSIFAYSKKIYKINKKISKTGIQF